MSELGDFEKIEFQQIALSGPSTGSNESGYLAVTRQQSTSEDSVSTMTNSMEQTMASSMETEQLKHPEFEMAWKTREEVIGNLNQHTKLLSGILITADAQEKMQKANKDLMATLMNVPLKVEGQLKNSKSPESRPDGDLNGLVLDLSWELKSRIMHTLILNHHVLMAASYVSSERKTKLIDQNTDLACELLKLRTRTVEVPSDSSKGTGNLRI